MCKTICTMQHFSLLIMVRINIVYFFQKAFLCDWMAFSFTRAENRIFLEYIPLKICITIRLCIISQLLGKWLKNNSLSLKKNTVLVTLVELTENWKSPAWECGRLSECTAWVCYMGSNVSSEGLCIFPHPGCSSAEGKVSFCCQFVNDN